MKSNKVTNPILVAKLNGGSKKVTDPSLIAQLNGDSENPETYLDNLSNSENFLSKLPRNILIGLTHAGRNLHNVPHDIASSLEQRTKPIGDIFNKLPGPSLSSGKPISEYLPYDPQDYGDVFGQKGPPSLFDSLIQKGVEHAPELYGFGGLVKSGLRKFPITQKGAARQLRDAEQLIQQRGVDLNPMHPQLINQSYPFLPKTHATNELLKKSASGEYGPSFSLQSQIGHHERALRKSPLASERLLAPEARELKQRILSGMETNLRSQGHHDIADLLKGGLDDYRKYIKFRDEIKPIIKKLGIPTSVMAFLGFGTKKGKQLAGKLID